MLTVKNIFVRTPRRIVLIAAAFFITSLAFGDQPQVEASTSKVDPYSSSSALLSYNNSFNEPRTSRSLVVQNDLFYFVYIDGNSELWRLESGGSQAVKLKTISNGFSSGMYAIGSKLIFFMEDIAPGQNEVLNLTCDVWASGGTAATTLRVKSMTYSINSYSDRRCGSDFAKLSSTEALFLGHDATNEFGLWKTDGTSSGTALVKDLIETINLNGTVRSNVSTMSTVGDRVTFWVKTSESVTELFISDGTSNGTVAVEPVGTVATSNLFDYVGTKAYFANSVGVYLLDESIAMPSVELKLSFVNFKTTQGFDEFEVEQIRASGSGFFFRESHMVGETWTNGWWYYDSTTSQYRALKLGLVSYHGGQVINDVLFFTSAGTSDGQPQQLWKSDGTVAGTTLVKDLALHDIEVVGYPRIFGSSIAFIGIDFTGKRRLWISDGTENGTFEITSHPFEGLNEDWADIQVGTTEIYGVSFDVRSGYSFTRSNGTLGSYQVLDEIYEGPDFESQKSIQVNDKLLSLMQRTTDYGEGIWMSDGTISGTSEVVQLSNFWQPTGFKKIGNTVFFSATSANEGREIWKLDLATSTASIVKDINTGVANSRPVEISAVNNRLLFSAYTPADGRELWISDGTSSGTSRLVDIAPGGASSFPRSITPFADGALLAATTSTSGEELWFSDGTAGGTRMVEEITAGSTGSGIDLMTVAGGRAFFFANNGQAGNELWVTDGTNATLVKDVITGPESSQVGQMWAVGSNVYFYELTTGLWRSDGTSGGTQKVSNLQPNYLVEYGANALFTSFNGDLNHIDNSSGVVSLVNNFGVYEAESVFSVDQAIYISLMNTSTYETGLYEYVYESGVTHLVETVNPSNCSPRPIERVGNTLFYSSCAEVSAIPNANVVTRSQSPTVNPTPEVVAPLPVATPLPVTQPEVTQPQPSASASLPVPEVKKSLTVTTTRPATAKSIASSAGLTIPKGAKTKLSVASSSKKNCKVVGLTIRAVASGNCVVTVSVTTPAKGKIKATTKSKKVTLTVVAAKKKK